MTKPLASECAKEWWTAVDVDTVGDFIVASQSENKAVPDLK